MFLLLTVDRTLVCFVLTGLTDTLWSAPWQQNPGIGASKVERAHMAE